MAISAYVISAIAGCFNQESGINPGIWEGLVQPSDTFWHVHTDGYGGYGLGQLTNTMESAGVAWRLLDYYQWVVSVGYAPYDGNAQLEYYFNVEQVWFNDPVTRGNYTTIQQFLNTSSTNIPDLVWDFLANWEGVPGDHYNDRVNYANTVYSYIQQHYQDNPSSYTWIQGNRNLDPPERLNNAMCMYFALQGLPPGPGPGPGPSPAADRKRNIIIYTRPLYKRFRAKK